MKKTVVTLFVVLCLLVQEVYSQQLHAAIDEHKFDPSTLLWYKAPAGMWEEALPVGNGRLGAMVFGNYDEERIQLNEDTYWSGGPYSTVVKDGYKVLPEIQQDIFNGKPLEAHKLFGRHLMGYPVEQQKYQSLANLVLRFGNAQQVTNYKRWLDLNTGITGVSYVLNGVTYAREVLSSAPDQTIAIRIKADKPGSISFRASLRGVRNSAMSNYATDYFRMDALGNDGLVLTGKSADYMGITGRLRYEARIKAIPEGGTIKTDDAELVIENANAVTLYFVAATNFISYKDVSGDEHNKAAQYLQQIEGKSYEAARTAAISDYQSLFNRVGLKLGSGINELLPTDERLKAAANTADPQLAALCFNFGRYVLIASSRPGTQPANLQGIWNDDMNPEWDSKYTININTEMNYWPVESANLSELSEPMIKMVKELTDQGSQVAKEHYGAGGWVCHQNTDIWRVAAPMDGPTWGTFTVGGAWLTTQLWEHYLFTKDEKYLSDIYPVLKGATEFFMDFMVTYPNNNKNWLVTCPSTSPENPPKGPGYKYFYDEVTAMYYFTTICAGSSIDMQIIADLFDGYLHAAALLHTDTAFAHNVAAARARLAPPQIGANGMLQEWVEDFDQLEDKHRHISHLYGLYPGNVISAKRTPELIDGVKKVLEERGDEGAGFSRAWKMSLWARLYDGERAYKIFKGYLADQCYPQLFAKCFKPLQVDGTLGVTAGITEMLLQSHEGLIDLLPALPADWHTGQFNGLCARGAFEVSASWKEGAITSIEILSKQGGACSVLCKTPVKVNCNGKKVPLKRDAKGMITFATEKGKRYVIIPV